MIALQQLIIFVEKWSFDHKSMFTYVNHKSDHSVSVAISFRGGIFILPDNHEKSLTIKEYIYMKRIYQSGHKGKIKIY